MLIKFIRKFFNKRLWIIAILLGDTFMQMCLISFFCRFHLSPTNKNFFYEMKQKFEKNYRIYKIANSWRFPFITFPPDFCIFHCRYSYKIFHMNTLSFDNLFSSTSFSRKNSYKKYAVFLNS